jgi:hypothetical protein
VFEGSCWAHARRKFVKLDELDKSPVAARMIARAKNAPVHCSMP